MTWGQGRLVLAAPMDAARRSVQMNFGGLIRGRRGRCVRLVSLLAAVGCMGLVQPAASGASVLSPWGSSLSATPSMDTANGASSQTHDMPLSSWNGDISDNRVR